MRIYVSYNKNMYFTIVSIERLDSVCNFDLNNEKQNVFPELNVNKIKRYAIKHKIKIDTTTTNAAWFDGYDYYARIDVLTYCINTINKNIKRKSVLLFYGGTTLNKQYQIITNLIHCKVMAKRHYEENECIAALKRHSLVNINTAEKLSLWQRRE